MEDKVSKVFVLPFKTLSYFGRVQKLQTRGLINN